MTEYEKKVFNELRDNLSKAGITIYEEDGSIKRVDTVMTEMSQVVDKLPPKLVGSIVANFSGLAAEDSSFVNR